MRSWELALYTLTSIRHFLMHCQGEFVKQSRGSTVGDHFLLSHDLNV